MKWIHYKYGILLPVLQLASYLICYVHRDIPFTDQLLQILQLSFFNDSKEFDHVCRI